MSRPLRRSASTSMANIARWSRSNSVDHRPPFLVVHNEDNNDEQSIKSLMLVMMERLNYMQSTTLHLEESLQQITTVISATNTKDNAAATPAKEAKPKQHEEPVETTGLITHHQLWWLLIFAINFSLVGLTFGLASIKTMADRSELATTFALMNLVATIGIRDGTFLLILYKIVVKIPCCKYFFNRMLHCTGGIHTGCALMILTWAVISLVLNILASKAAGGIPLADSIMLGLLCFGLIVMIALAVPPFRHRYHNIFERVHRFLGWTLLFLLTAILSTSFSRRNSWKTPQAIADSVLMVFSLVLVFYPWLLIERQNVDLCSSERGNVVVVRMHGKGRPGAFARISFDLIEWHSFSVAFTNRTDKSYGLIVGVAGDWTKRLAQKCLARNSSQVSPDHIEGGQSNGTIQHATKAWIRWHRPLGFMYSLHAYNRVICVGTGAGIAPILPHIANNTTTMHVVWIAKNHVKVYGEEISNQVLNHPYHTIYDTGLQGRPRPDIALEKYEEFQAEAVFVVSNAPFTEQVRAACQKRGISAFGAVFDS